MMMIHVAIRTQLADIVHITIRTSEGKATLYLNITCLDNRCRISCVHDDEVEG